MAQAASKTCEVCVSAPGSQYCIDCEEYYCENCKLLHNRQKLSRNHQFQKASDLIPEGKSKCSEHKEEFTLFCNTCNVPACTSCVTGKHKGHTFSKFVDEVAKLQVENETKIHAKTNEANQNIKKIEESLKSFDNSVESVIKTITDEGSMIKRMVDKAVAQMITLVKEQSKKEKDKLMKMLSDAKSVLVAGQALDRKRNELDNTRQDESLVQKINNLKEEIDKLTINSLPEFPNISFSRKAVAEDDIRQLIGTFTIRSRVGMIAHLTNLNKTSNDKTIGHCMVCNKEQNPRHIVSKCAPVLEKKEQRHEYLYRCSTCGSEEIMPFEDIEPTCANCLRYMTYVKDM